jgi:DNA-directed RNA polymerase subunit E'/Rpb7
MNTEDSKSKDTKSKDTKSKDTKSKDTKTKDSKTKDTRSKDTKSRQKETKSNVSSRDASSDSPSDDISIVQSAIKLNELIYPCKDEVLYTRVILHPHQMNNELYINLKKNLVDKTEGKCIKDGFVIKVYKILDYTNGVIEPENFTGAAVYDVKYLAKICTALKDTMLIAKITSYSANVNFVLAEFGSIIKIIFTKNERDLNTKAFMVGNDKSVIHMGSQKKISLGDYVKIQIKTFRFHQNDTVIKCMGYLDNLATPDEIENYSFKDDHIKDIKQILNQNNVYFNEDSDNEQEGDEKEKNIMEI